MIDEMITEKWTFGPGLARFKRLARTRKVFIHANLQAQSVENSEFYYNLTGCVKVTKKEAERFLTDAYYASIRPSVRVKLTYSKRCLFVG